MVGNNGISKVDRLKAEWATKVYCESSLKSSTARAVHYFALGRTDYPVFNKKGLVKFRDYRDQDDANITEWISLAKRLGLIPWDALPDETVGEYGELEFIPSDQNFSYQYSLARPDTLVLEAMRKYLQRQTLIKEYVQVDRSQPYHLELWVEKSTMNGILLPVCRKYHSVLVTFKGHCSWGGVWKLCKRVADDDRPALVLYLSDMDASGFLMARELCDKVTEINNNFFGRQLDIRVKRIGLTPRQVVENRIPMVPRKEGEKANAALYRSYVESRGLDPNKKAELDALERYYDGGVQAFVESWLSRYYDSTLDQRCAAATEMLLDSTPDNPDLPESVVQRRHQILRELEELIKIERSIVIPDGNSMEANVVPETYDPNDEAWLLDTTNDIYPGPHDIDFCKEGIADG